MLKLFWIARTKVLNASNGLLNFDLLVLFLLGLGRESLPRERPSDKVHEHYANLFEVISSSLLDAEMSVE
jgi:hypothetical protein